MSADVSSPILALSGVSKSFPGVRSLDGVDFEARAGEVHALLGENGAGKSTLIKIVAGAYSPDAGVIRFDGAARVWDSPRTAQQAGIHVIYQELMLFPELSVAEYIFIGAPPRNRLGLIDHRAMRDRAAAALERLGHRLDPRAKVGALSVADQQMVEIAKALTKEAKLLVLDEPTAVISGREADLLLERVRRLREAGVCVIYISHRLEEIFRLCDRVTVLKDGRRVATRAVAEVDRPTLVGMMVGRKLADIFPPKRPSAADAPVVMSVRGLKAAPRVRDVSFDLRAEEILGLAGLVGAGRSEAAHAIFGSGPREAGEVTFAGAPYEKPTPRASIDAGLGFLTEDRKGEGLLMQLDVAANISAPKLGAFQHRLVIDRDAEATAAAEELGRFRIAAPGHAASVRPLSGGNQQKILFARWTRACRRALILDEPTRGVDVGAKVEIYGIIHDLARAGIAVLVISSELPEIIGLCSRVIVMREGRVAGELSGDAIDEQEIMRLATHDPERPTIAA
jgi:ABC-type sugar transport system ATPase subunit